MACGGSGGNKILLCLTLFVAVTSFCHCTTLTRLNALDKLRENSSFSQSQPKGTGLHHGRLFIGQNSLQGAKLRRTKVAKNHLDSDAGYQADMGWLEPRQTKGQGEGFIRPDESAVERLLKLEPRVECTGNSMKLQVQDAPSTPGSLLFVDRGSRLSPLPLSKLPPSCGYTIRSTRRDLVLVAPYDGCFVALEEDSYVLPLQWLGLPVRVSCPLMRTVSSNPPMVTCHTEGMVVKTEWTVAVTKIKVNLNGNWELLMNASSRCGFSVVVHPEGVVISVHYAPCLEKKDGMYTLKLAGDGEIKISCPSLLAAQPESTKQPTGPKQQTETPGKEVQPQSAVPQVPGFPENQEVPNKKPNQGPKGDQLQLPYYPYYPQLIYPYPDTKATPTAQPTSSPITKTSEMQPQQTVHPSNLPVTPVGQLPQPLIPLPLYPWSAQPDKVPVKEPPVQPPATQPPNAKGEIPFYIYPYYIKPPKHDVPPAHRPEGKPIPTSTPIVQATEGQKQQLYYPFTFSPQPPVSKPPPSESEEHVLPKPFKPLSGSIHPGGQEQKPIYPFHFYLQPQVPENPQVEHHLQPLYPEAPEKTVPSKPPVSQEPQGQIHQPLYPYPFYPAILPQGPYQTHMTPTQQTPTPASKGQVRQPLGPVQPEASIPKVPGIISPSKPAPESNGPSQPEAPQGQVYLYPYPVYPQRIEKPTAAPQPTNPEAPQGQVNQYPYPPPNEKPTTEPQPLQPEAPQGQVYQYPYPAYPQPTAVPQPAQPETPQGQVYQYPYPAYPQPTAVPQPAQPEAPQGQVHHYPYPVYPLTTAVPQPAQPEAPQGQVHQYPYPVYPQATAVPQPAQPDAPQGQVYQYPYPVYPQATAVPQPAQPEAPQGQVYQYPYPVYPLPTAVPEAAQTEAPQGQVYQYPYPVYPQPTAVPEPAQTEAPQGQVHQYPYPVYPQPTEKPTAVPQPAQPEAPHGQVYQYPYPVYPLPTAVPEPAQTEAPQGQVHQYPYPVYLQPTAVPQPAQPEAPQGQVHQYPYPVYPQPTAVPQPAQPEAPQGQVHQYPYPVYPLPTAVPQPAQPEAPQHRVHQYPYPVYPQPTEKPTTVPQPEVPHLFYPYFFYPKQEPVNQPADKPSHKPSYPQPSKITGTNDGKTPTKTPVPSEQPPSVKPPDDPVYHPFNPYQQQPQYPQSIKLPLAVTMQQPQQVTLTQHSNDSIASPGSPQMPFLYCPQVCPSSFSNCCPQIAFHQHLHHIVPAGLGSKDTSPVYSALPFFQSGTYSGYGNSLAPTPLPQEAAKETAVQDSTISTSVPTSLPSLQHGNEKQPHLLPPDGNPAVLIGGIHRKPINHEQTTFLPNLAYPYWPYLPHNDKLKNLLQIQPEAHSNDPSKQQATGNGPVNQLMQYAPYYIRPPEQQMSHLSPGDLKNPSGPPLISFIGQYHPQAHIANQQNEPTTRHLQPSNEKSTESKRLTLSKIQSEPNPFLVPYMLQDAHAPTYNNSSQQQPFVSGSKRSTKHEATVYPYSEQKNVVLLQHGPPAKEPQNLKRHPKGLAKVSNPLSADNVNYMPSPFNESESLPLLVSVLDGSHLVPLPQDSSFSSAPLKPESPQSLKDVLKPSTHQGSKRRIPGHFPRKAFQQWSSTPNQQANGLKQSTQSEGGDQEPK